MVPVTPLRTALRAALEQDPSPSLAPPDRLAAVLAPLVEEPVASLVFTVRSSDLSRHAGEISFPGGLQDPGETLSQTALRESFEEIGLDPGTTDVLGALPPVHTTVSGILVVPFVGMLESMPAFVVSEEEIEEVLTFTVGRLAEVERPVEVAREPGRVWRGFAYELDGHVIWGATGCDVARAAPGHPEGGVMADPGVNGEIAPEDRELRALLGDAHTIAVVGLSSKPDRPSNSVAVLPAGPRLSDRAGEPQRDRGARRARVSVAPRHPGGRPCGRGRRVPPGRGDAGRGP